EKINLAEEIINKSIKMKQQTQDIRGLAFAIYGKAKVLFAQKKYILAEQEFNESIRIHQDMGERLGLAMAYQKMGKLYLESNQLDKAKEVASKGLEICRLYNITIIKFKCYYLFYTIYRLEANHIIALEYLEKYLKEKEAVINTQTLKVIDNYDMLVQMKTMQKEAELHKERAEMIEINNRAEEKARVRQEFLSTMSHEIRTPLNAITTVVSMLSENSNKEDFILIDSLKFSSNHLMQIINDILDFNKLELGKMKLELYSTNIKHFTTNFWKTYEFQAIEKKLQFNLIIDSNINDYYLLDETKITQILGNLIGNSIKFTERGEIKLELKLIKKNKSNDTILFKISDTGEGIEKNNIKKIFDSFSQLKNIITRKIGGTGLGLAIVKKLIHLHKSEIYIESEIGSGTIFWFELKLKKSEKIIQNSTIFKNKDLNGLHVLLAEDNAINALIAIKLLSKWGITVDHAVNGLEAIDKSNSNKYDYILMDIHMPELDGYQATKSIRMCLNGNSNTPIFGLTADISVKDNIEFKNYFSGFLLKPIEIDKLKMALSN
ncbi:ATP-binding protein, partial [Flavobacterium sp.]|uniref:ATP-binding protein n=1 Tax=Flavobacterium sp. TaxID=239 RepID=UPI0037538039